MYLNGTHVANNIYTAKSSLVAKLILGQNKLRHHDGNQSAIRTGDAAEFADVYAGAISLRAPLKCSAGAISALRRRWARAQL